MPVIVDMPELLSSNIRYEVTCQCGHVLFERQECYDYEDVAILCPRCGHRSHVFGIVNRARFAGEPCDEIAELAKGGYIPRQCAGEIAADGFEVRMYG